MSAFLGHIHYWLYRKIQLLVERENLILEKTTKVVDDLAEELHSISVDTYGEPINPSIPLENIISMPLQYKAKHVALWLKITLKNTLHQRFTMRYKTST